MANLITECRILCSIVLLFCPVFSTRFFALYIAAGMTDVLDGFVARRTKTVSEFGAKLDTAADLVFVTVCLFKLIPALPVQSWMYIGVAVIAGIKTVNFISGYILQKGFVSIHSVMNKIAGALLFLLPFTLHWIPLRYTAAGICVVATFAAIQEGWYIRNG